MRQLKAKISKAYSGRITFTDEPTLYLLTSLFLGMLLLLTCLDYRFGLLTLTAWLVSAWTLRASNRQQEAETNEFVNLAFRLLILNSQFNQKKI